MAADFVSIAYDNFINKERVLLVTAVDSSPITVSYTHLTLPTTERV